MDLSSLKQNGDTKMKWIILMLLVTSCASNRNNTRVLNAPTYHTNCKGSKEYVEKCVTIIDEICPKGIIILKMNGEDSNPFDNKLDILKDTYVGTPVRFVDVEYICKN